MKKDRMVEELLEMLSIDSVSLKERQMADFLKTRLEGMGLNVYEDDAGQKAGGSAGNLICTVKGNKDVPAILMTAHMDTVNPGIGKKPFIDGNLIKTDGTTVLGGDDLAGVECIIEALRVIRERNLEHGDIQIAFTIAEEIGLLGSKNIDYSKIYAKYAFVLDDGGRIGKAVIKAPSQSKIDILVSGKASHAGVEPENGIDAIKIAAEAISIMKLGRIDEETTANVGIINGGHATNIVCDRVKIEAEARSRDENKLRLQIDHMEECFQKTAAKYGGEVEFTSRAVYPAFKVEETDEIIKVLKKASKVTGIELSLEATGGGSDTNIINSKGISAVDLSVGMDKIHSVEERISIDDIVKAAEFLIAIITCVE